MSKKNRDFQKRVDASTGLPEGVDHLEDSKTPAVENQVEEQAASEEVPETQGVENSEEITNNEPAQPEQEEQKESPQSPQESPQKEEVTAPVEEPVSALEEKPIEEPASLSAEEMEVVNKVVASPDFFFGIRKTAHDLVLVLNETTPETLDNQAALALGLADKWLRDTLGMLKSFVKN